MSKNLLRLAHLGVLRNCSSSSSKMTANIVGARWISVISGERLVATEYGDPSKVVQMESYNLENVMDEQAIVQILASPVNPVDINMIQGIYALKPELPFKPGMEGVGIVKKVGSGPNPYKLQEGHWVIPKRFDFLNGGCWQSYLLGLNDDFLPIPKISMEAAATISVNPTTAYRMLKDYEKLTAGDTIIQNGGNSGVGQAVIQLCKEFGLGSISIVRDREHIQQLKNKMLKLGDENTMVFTEEEFKQISKKGKIPTVKLALNCVGGKSSAAIARPLEEGRTLITYGGMSRQPVLISTAQLIFQDIKCIGFGISRWNELNSVEDRLQMLKHIAELCLAGKFIPPDCKVIPLSNFKEALENNPLKGFIEKKYILSF